VVAHRCRLPLGQARAGVWLGATSRRSSPSGKRKQPYYLERRYGDPIALAGRLEEWRRPDRKGEPIRTVTIVTTTPNETMAPIHDRMPVILPPSACDRWLDPTNDDTEALAQLLVPAPAELLVARPVTTAVSSTRNDSPDLIAEATPDQLVG
jgi:putative SOS response-associated peptidase YedK